MSPALPVLTVKYDTNGNPIWVARYQGPSDGFRAVNALAVDAQGSVYVIASFSSTFSTAVTLKYDANGNQLWVVRYQPPLGFFNRANALAVDSQSSVYVTGAFSLPGSFSQSNATLKYDTNGNLLGTGAYGGAAIALDAQNNVYVTGSSAGGFPGGTPGIVTAKYGMGAGVSGDITAQVSVIRSGSRYVRATKRYVQTVTVRNTGATAFPGPISLVLDNLSANAALFNRAGVTASQPPFNSPYVKDTLARRRQQRQHVRSRRKRHVHPGVR